MNFISLLQEVRGIFVIKAAVEMQNNLVKSAISKKWWNLNDQSSHFQSILKYNLLGLHPRMICDEDYIRGWNQQIMMLENG